MNAYERTAAERDRSNARIILDDEPVVKMQTLRCHHGAGHDWTRPSQRGKPPRFCPDHKVELSAAPKPPANTGGPTAAHIALCEHAIDCLDSLGTFEARAVEYAVEHIMSGRREVGDEDVLASAIKAHLRTIPRVVRERIAA